jgi:hypothetical protein
MVLLLSGVRDHSHSLRGCVLRHAADQMPVADARTEILKAIAVLRDRKS